MTTPELHGFIVMYGSRSTKVYAKNQLDAKEKGIAFFRVSKAKQHTVSAHLVEKNGQAVTQVLA